MPLSMEIKKRVKKSGYNLLIWAMVSVFGKQMDSWPHTKAKAAALPNGYFEYKIPSDTVLHRVSPDFDGRTLDDVLLPGAWYNFHFEPDTKLDLDDHSLFGTL